MEMKFINNQGKKLIIFFAGWGMDYRPFSHLHSSEYDVALFFNYTNPNPDLCSGLECQPGVLHPDCPIYNMINSYAQINVIAFGAGVWASSILLDNYFRHLSPQNRFRSLRLLKKIKKSIAINGTLCTVSNIWGMPQTKFNKIIENLEREISSGYTFSTSECLNSYLREMCSDAATLERYLQNLPHRGLEDIKNELASFKENFVFSNAIFWNRVIIGNNDTIIPSENQNRFWSEYELGLDKNNRLAFNAHDFSIEHTDNPHFPFFNWERWEDMLNL